MIGALWAALRALPALRAAVLGALALAALIAALWGPLSHFEAKAAAEARRDLDAQQIQEVKDAILRSAPGPRPSGDEFLDCLRRGEPGCL